MGEFSVGEWGMGPLPSLKPTVGLHQNHASSSSSRRRRSRRPMAAMAWSSEQWQSKHQADVENTDEGLLHVRELNWFTREGGVVLRGRAAASIWSSGVVAGSSRGGTISFGSCGWPWRRRRARLQRPWSGVVKFPRSHGLFVLWLGLKS